MIAVNDYNALPVNRHQIELHLIALRSNLVAFSTRLSGSLDTAEDIAQEAICMALRNYMQFRPGTSVKAWVFTIARNYYYTQLRRTKIKAAWDSELLERTLRNPAEILETEAVYELHRLLRCLACLSHEHSNVLIAIGYLGYSYLEAAHRLGCELNTVKSRTSRARVVLQQLYDGTNTLPPVSAQWLATVSEGTPGGILFSPIAQVYRELFGMLHKGYLLAA